MIKVLFNPLGHNSKGRVEAKKIAEKIKGDVVVFDDITQIEDIYSYISDDRSDKLVIAGGDGTLNQFINQVNGRELPRDIYYFPAGSGNDFCRDLGAEEQGYFKINEYIEKLPTVEVNDNKYLFVNGVGFGIDGFCCQEGDKQRIKSADSPINYTSIVLKGFLYKYKPANVTVTVDGVEHKYKKVWVAPIMHGRFYGGGMMIAPNQMRNNENDTLTCVILHSAGRLKILTKFASIFTGDHLKYKDVVDVHEGKNITVSFDRPTPCQIDGETIKDITVIKGYFA